MSGGIALARDEARATYSLDALLKIARAIGLGDRLLRAEPEAEGELVQAVVAFFANGTDQEHRGRFIFDGEHVQIDPDSLGPDAFRTWLKAQEPDEDFAAKADRIKSEILEDTEAERQAEITRKERAAEYRKNLLQAVVERIGPLSDVEYEIQLAALVEEFNIRREGLDAIRSKCKRQRADQEARKQAHAARESAAVGGEILTLFQPQNMRALLTDVEKADEDRLGEYHGVLARNLELGYQLGAAFTFESLEGSDGRLQRAGTTVYNYSEEGYRWRPLIDITRPDSPFNDVDYLAGNQTVVDLFGPDFRSTGPAGRTIRKHFNKAKVVDTRSFFVKYAKDHAPLNEGLLLRRPGKTISTADGLLIFEDHRFRLEPHRPEHGQMLPAFPFHYRDWFQTPQEDADAVLRYLGNLARNIPDEQRPTFIKLLGFLIGYTLTPYREKFFPILIGGNDSGKTLYLALLEQLHSETRTFVEVDFVQMEKNPTQFDNAVFVGALLASHDDFAPGGKLPAQKLKGLANQSKPMTVNQKFKPVVTTINNAASYISTNGYPQSDDSYLAGRMLCVPFEAKFTAEEKANPENVRFCADMRSPRILQALFDFGVYCVGEFFDTNSIEPFICDEVHQLTDRVAGRLNDVQAWLTEAIESKLLVESPAMRARRSELYRLYESRKYPVSRSAFYTTMRQRYGNEVLIDGIEHFRGLSIVPQPTDGYSWPGE